jgi:hypothetical protein
MLKHNEVCNVIFKYIPHKYIPQREKERLHGLILVRSKYLEKILSVLRFLNNLDHQLWLSILCTLSTLLLQIF